MMKKLFFQNLVCLLLGSLFFFSSSCGQKKTWSQQDKNAWLSNCNVKFTKEGAEPKELKRFCDCALNLIQYDFTYEELNSETIPANKQQDYFNSCSFNW